MGFLDNVADKAVPQGSSLNKPLVLAFISLLASGALSRKQEPAPTPSTSPTSQAHAGGLLGGLGGLLEKLQESGHGEVTKSWIGSGQNQPISPAHSVRLSVRRLLRLCPKRRGLSEQELTAQLSQLLPGLVDKLTPQGRLSTHDELARFGG